MLKGIPHILSPQLLEVLAEMGHGDSIVIGDAYFAAKAMAKAEGNLLVRADGLNAFDMVDAICTLMPLDSWFPGSVTAMGFPDRQTGEIVGNEVTERFKEVIRKHDEKAADDMRYIDRLGFYELAKKAFCVLATGDGKTNGCLILRKGVF